MSLKWLSYLTAVVVCCAVQYLRSGKNPFACMLLYLATGVSKLALVLALFKMSPQHGRVATFLANNFNQERYMDCSELPPSIACEAHFTPYTDL